MDTTDKRRHADDLEAKIDMVIDQLHAIERAFPDGPEAHRASHEAMMRAAAAQQDAARAQEKFWNEIKLDVIKKGIWGAVVIVLGLIMVGSLTTLAAKLGIATMGIK